MTQTDAGTTTLASRREWIGLAVLGLPTILLSLDIGVLFLALPQLSADLQPSGTQTLWIMDVYAFMTASLLITMGTLGDRIGRRRLLMIGAAAFGVASVFAAFSSSPEMLIATRALLGIAGATLAPSTLALISTMFQDPGQRATAIGVWMGCFMLGAALGPVLGGLLIQAFWWGSVFILGVPVMLTLLVLAPILLPEDRNTGEKDPLDLLSTALVLVTMLTIVFALKKIAHEDVGGRALSSLVVGLACGALFLRRQLRLDSPLIDVRLTSKPAFSASLLLLLFGPAVMGGTGLFMNQYLQMVRDLSPLETGLLTVPPALATVLGAVLGPGLAGRYGAGRTLVAGSLTLAGGALLLALVDVNTSLPVVVLASGLIALGFGPIASLGTGMIIATAPPEKAGAAASMSETSSELGIGLGIGLLGTLGTAVYRHSVAGRLPAEASADEASRDSLAGALSSAENMSGDVAKALTDVAQHGFTTGMSAVAWACVLIGLLLSGIAATLLRDVTPVDPLDQGGTADDEATV